MTVVSSHLLTLEKKEPSEIQDDVALPTTGDTGKGTS
jgi:hypothetical protein